MKNAGAFRGPFITAETSASNSPCRCGRHIEDFQVAWVAAEGGDAAGRLVVALLAQFDSVADQAVDSVRVQARPHLDQDVDSAAAVCIKLRLGAGNVRPDPEGAVDVLVILDPQAVDSAMTFVK